MDYSEFRRHLGKAGLTINEFASLLDVSPSAVSNYGQKTDVPRSYAALAVLLGHAADNNLDFRIALSRFGITVGSGDRRKITRLDEYRVGNQRASK
jgi:hypothetical protein